MARALLFPSILLLSACGDRLGEVESTGASTSFIEDSLPRYWYADSFPLKFVYAEDFEEDFGPGDEDEEGNNPFEQMMLQWNKAVASRNFFDFPLESVPNVEHSDLRDYRDGDMGIYKHHSWFRHGPDGRSIRYSVAIAQIYSIERDVLTDSHHKEILHVDILFNTREWEFTTEANDPGRYDLYTIFLHEIGHALGLRHTREGSSVMRPTFMTSESMRAPNAYDKESIREIYGDGGPSKGARSPPERKRWGKRDVTSYEEEELERTVISLDAEGMCQHYRDSRLIYSHQLP